MITRLASRLPVAATPLVGRTEEVRRIRELVCAGARLLTLTGAGGTGKIRLAMAAAAEMANDFPDGVCFVDLSSLIEASVVAGWIARALDVPEGGGLGVADALKARFRQHQTLLVLDNFERVLPAARMVAERIAACPALSVMVTS